MTTTTRAAQNGTLIRHRIVSGEVPQVGLRVLTNEYRWGTITKLGKEKKYDGSPTECGTYCEAWHEVTYDDGRRVDMNCDRLTTREPRLI